MLTSFSVTTVLLGPMEWFRFSVNRSSRFFRPVDFSWRQSVEIESVHEQKRRKSGNPANPTLASRFIRIYLPVALRFFWKSLKNFESVNNRMNS